MRKLVLIAAMSLTAGCTSENAKEATAAVVGKSIELGKGTISGIAAGVKEGRKTGESADGARVVSAWQELGEEARITIASVEKQGEGESATSNVTFAVENLGERPLRITGIEVVGLDDGGFVVKPAGGIAHDLTVPPKAKDRLQVALKSASLKAVRVWGHDLPVP